MTPADLSEQAPEASQAMVPQGLSRASQAMVPQGLSRALDRGSFGEDWVFSN